MKMNTPIDILNRTDHTGTALICLLVILVVWCLVWRLFLGAWLYKHNVGTFWYVMYEIGPIGTFGIALVVLILLAMLISSIQYLFTFGGKIALAICAFWAGLITIGILLFKSIHK